MAMSLATCGRYLSKAIGITAIGLVGYDAHTMGKLKADSYMQSEMADSCIDYYDNATRISESSIVQSKLKNKLFKMRMNSNWGNIINSSVGYSKGFNSVIVDNLIPLGLGLTAIFTKGKKHPLLLGGCAVGLVIDGLVKFVRDVCGYGQKSELNSRIN